MKYTITALDLHFLVRELKQLISAKVDKIYQPEKNEFLFVLHIPNSGKKILRVMLPGYLFLTELKGDVPETPLHFCMMLRKYLGSARLRDIRQLGFERILDLLFETKDAKYRLIIELFSKGNLILCGEDYTIKSPLFPQRWKDRVIRGNVKYEYPKREHDFLTIKYDEFADVIRGSDKESIVKTLALDLGLGGRYAEELCLRAGIDKNKKSLETGAIKKLFSETEKLRDADIRASVVKKDDHVTDIIPIDMLVYKDLTANRLKTFNEALNEVLSVQIIETQKERHEERYTKEIKRLEKVKKEQEETIEKLKASIKDNQMKGEFIFENYQAISEILTELNKARKKYPWKEIRKRLEGHKVIKEINEKNKEVVVDIE